MTRSCGECSLCCSLLEISAERAPEIGPKPAGETCRHCTAPGCSIYATRPQLCRDFACQWLLDERLGEEWKPSNCGMILSFDIDASMLIETMVLISEQHGRKARGTIRMRPMVKG